jgi:CAP-Gly domain-containing linker protein 1
LQLTKEISELEALLETKIYREDELERELETLRRRSSKTARKTSKSSLELDPVPEDRPASSFANGTGSATSTATAMPKDGAHSRSNSLITSESDVCEICERPGHDIFSCDLLKESSSPTLMMSRIVPEDATAVLSPVKPEPSRITERLYCEDCDSEGHTSNECPYALDVF